MELKDIAAISGKEGLFEVVKPSRGGVIVQTLDERKKKMVINAQHRVSVLSEVSIYTLDQEGSKGLDVVFKTIYDEFGYDTGLSKSAPDEELEGFLKHILPNYDPNKVYTSDIKKLVSWYNILVDKKPEVIENLAGNDSSEEKEENNTGEASSDEENTNNKPSDN